MPKDDLSAALTVRKQELDRRFVTGVMSLIYSEHGYREYAERIRRVYPYLDDLAAECEARAALMRGREQSPNNKTSSRSKSPNRYGK